MDLMFPKTPRKKKKKKHHKSILQPKEDKRCYLCMLLHDDFREKPVHEHHIIMGNWGKSKSEELGLKCNLCIPHHQTGPEAVHQNVEISRVLQQEAQQAYERTHTHEEWMEKVGRNYIDTSEKG